MCAFREYLNLTKSSVECNTMSCDVVERSGINHSAVVAIRTKPFKAAIQFDMTRRQLNNAVL